MAAFFVPWRDINDVTDDVLQGILKYGDIEDIVSKDRVCKWFKSTNDSVLKKKIKLTLINGDFGFKIKNYFESSRFAPIFVMKVFERMKKLTDGSQLGFDSWTPWQVERLAVFNPKLIQLWPKSSEVESKYLKNVKRYISAVKEIHSSYTGEHVKHFFKMQDLDDPEDEMNLNRHSDLQLKITSSVENIKQQDEMGAKVLYELYLKPDGRLHLLEIP